MEINQVLELTKKAIRKNLAKWAYKDEPALLEALEAIESWEASQQPVQADLICDGCGKKETAPFDIGDKCICGGTFQAA